MKNKISYEPISIEITPLKRADVITTSGAFNGEEDAVSGWTRR